MSEEVRRRIFDPFYTTQPVGQGTGLGLSLSFSIVQKHGGRIEVRSTPGVGSCFSIWLPVLDLKQGVGRRFCQADKPAQEAPCKYRSP